MDNIHVTPPSEETTEIVCILDRSGSMQHLTSSTIEGYNTFLKDQKATPGKANWTLCLFDGGNYGWKPDHKTYEIIHASVDIHSVPELTNEVYKPTGGTALIDAVCNTINQVYERVKNDSSAKVIVMIITDGAENESKEFKIEQMKAMVKEREEKDKWAFLFLGANIDAFSAGHNYGISKGKTMAFSANTAGMNSVYSNLSASTKMYRSFSKRDLMDDVVNTDNLIADNGEAKEEDLNK